MSIFLWNPVDAPASAMEMLYQYLWKYSLLGKRVLTVDGRAVDIIYPGRHNTDAGPDFLGARLRIAGEEWGGNVEVHVKASDWFRHGHDTDPAYSNVILHLVAVNDAEVKGADGTPLPQVLATFPRPFVTLYSRLAEKISDLPCVPDLPAVPPLVVTDWLSTLSIERMQEKGTRILDTRKALDGDWHQTSFATLSRALGFGLNGDPFEMLARSLPLKYVLHHSDNLFQIEALLFGQAGMLDMSVHIFDEYYQSLCREYYFLARKYGLRPIRRDLWKYARTRPQNFPHRRIALLARALASDTHFLSEALDAGTDIAKAHALFGWTLEGYWTTHFDFDTPGHSLPATLSASSIDLLVINFLAPLLYAYGASVGNPELAEKGLDLWHLLKPESNSRIRPLRSAGIQCADAADSQALLQLRSAYCDRSRCLECRFGHTLLRATLT